MFHDNVEKMKLECQTLESNQEVTNSLQGQIIQLNHTPQNQKTLRSFLINFCDLHLNYFGIDKNLFLRTLSGSGDVLRAFESHNHGRTKTQKIQSTRIRFHQSTIVAWKIVFNLLRPSTSGVFHLMWSLLGVKLTELG